MPFLPYTPQDYYTILRQNFDPTFAPDISQEKDWWHHFEEICKNHQWDPYVAIERVFDWVKTAASTEKEKSSLAKGYPNLIELCHLPYLKLAHQDTKFRTRAEISIAGELEQLHRHAQKSEKPLETVCADERLLIRYLTRVLLCPPLRTPEQIAKWKIHLEKEARDPTVWKAYQKLNFNAKAIRDVFTTLIRE
jgi:hypothetical protein